MLTGNEYVRVLRSQRTGGPERTAPKVRVLTERDKMLAENRIIATESSRSIFNRKSNTSYLLQYDL